MLNFYVPFTFPTRRTIGRVTHVQINMWDAGCESACLLTSDWVQDI